MRTLLDLVEPHSLQLESIASAMESAGIGGDQNNGHAVILRRMAADIRSEAARGRMAGRFSAAANPGHVAVSGVLMACEAHGVKVPASRRWDSLESLNASLDAAFKNNTLPNALAERLELKSKIFAANLVMEEKPVDERLVRHAGDLLRKAGIPIPTKMYSLASLNAALDAARVATGDRLELKRVLHASGLLDQTDGLIPNTPTPSISASALKMARAVLQEIGLEEPAAGARLNLGVVNRAMSNFGLPMERTIPMKSALSAAGFID